MATKNISLADAENHLPDLIHMVEQGDEVVLTDHDQPKAKLVAVVNKNDRPRIFGRFRGKIHMADDFNDPLPDDFWMSGNP